MILVVHPGPWIQILTFYPSRIPDLGVKKAPDPGSGSGSATLIPTLTALLNLYPDLDPRGQLIADPPDPDSQQ
jgi:hypothetical protein